jgi:hypothetical protein
VRETEDLLREPEFLRAPASIQIMRSKFLLYCSLFVILVLSLTLVLIGYLLQGRIINAVAMLAAQGLAAELEQYPFVPGFRHLPAT